MPTLVERFLELSRQTPDKDALRVVDAGRVAGAKPRVVAVTYRQLEARAKAYGEALLVRGLDPGTRVAILARRRMEWVAADLACQMAGLISVPLFPNDAAPAHQRILQASDVRLAIAEDPWQAKKLVDAMPGLEIVLIDSALTAASGARMGAAELGVSGLRTLAELEARRGVREASELAARLGRVEPDAIVSLAYTPGTDGEAKGVMLTQDNLLSVATAAAAALERVARGTSKEGDKREPELQLLTMPLAQMLGRTTLWSALVAGIPTAIPRSDMTMLEDAAIFKPTFMIGVPAFFLTARAEVLREVKDGGGLGGLVSRWVGASALGPETSIFERAGSEVALRLVKGRLHKRLGGRCRFVVAAGAALPEGLADFYLRHGVDFREGYGMVETCALSHLDDGPTATQGSVGPPLAAFSHRLAADGELLVAGAGLTPGYWRDPDETTKVFDSDGYFTTGDLARTVGDGDALAITSRKRDIIVLSDGRSIAPRPIEDALCMGSAGLVPVVLVYGEQRTFASAVLGLDADALAHFAGHHGLGPGDFEIWSRHPKVHAHLEALIAKVNASQPAHAAIKKFAVLATPLSTEAGELTPTRTLRRAAAVDKFKPLLDSFYAESF